LTKGGLEVLPTVLFSDPTAKRDVDNGQKLGKEVVGTANGKKRSGKFSEQETQDPAGVGGVKKKDGGHRESRKKYCRKKARVKEREGGGESWWVSGKEIHKQKRTNKHKKRDGKKIEGPGCGVMGDS